MFLYAVVSLCSEYSLTFGDISGNTPLCIGICCRLWGIWILDLVGLVWGINAFQEDDKSFWISDIELLRLMDYIRWIKVDC